MNASRLVLLPAPRRLRARPGVFIAGPGRRIALPAGPADLRPALLFAGRRLQQALRAAAKVDWPLWAGRDDSLDGARFVLDPRRVRHDEGYELVIAPRGITLTARTPRGILHGVRTLTQILEQTGSRLPALAIADEPDFAHRGVMLDVSRDKVPTMRTLYELVDLLASWKLNQIQLYTEHTFAYRNHREVWKDASPLTGEEILALDAYCRERGVELVPNQNSFGHLHRWLELPRYKPLAEAPDGCETVWGPMKHPFSLNPTDPRSLALLREWFDELLPHFSSRQFNVGCDETIDLGKGRSKALADKIGVGRVYLDFLLKLHREVKSRGRKMQFWGDIILHHPELVRRLPRDLVAMEWGYEWNHPFNQDCARFRKAGIPFYVCPGTSSWTTITGRTRNMKGNIDNAAENGRRFGAIGMLNTDWGDQGHWQYQPISYAGFAYGAAAGWSWQANRRIDLAAALDHFAFRDSAGVMGKLALGLGNTYLKLGRDYPNATGFARAMLADFAAIRGYKNQTAAGWRRTMAAIRKAVRPLGSARMKGPDAALIAQEFTTAARTALHGCPRALLALNSTAKRAAAEKR
ncbi:MAG: family 20 glycosylhydrolase, partial [bacterium]